MMFFNHERETNKNLNFPRELKLHICGFCIQIRSSNSELQSPRLWAKLFTRVVLGPASCLLLGSATSRIGFFQNVQTLVKCLCGHGLFRLSSICKNSINLRFFVRLSNNYQQLKFTSSQRKNSLEIGSDNHWRELQTLLTRLRRPSQVVLGERL